jgi:transposase-like protein
VQIRDGVECERLRMFARDMRRAVELQGKNSEGIRAMIPRKGSILLPPDLMAPNSRADSTPDSPVLSEQQQRVPTNAMNNSLRQPRGVWIGRPETAQGGTPIVRLIFH